MFNFHLLINTDILLILTLDSNYKQEQKKDGKNYIISWNWWVCW